MFETKPWILILDDDGEVLQFLNEALTAVGCRVVACQRASEARQKVMNQKFEVILLDWVVEHGNSEQLLNFIRDPKGFNHNTRVVLISGQLDPDLIKRIGKMLDGVLIKPFNSEKLVAKIREFVKD